MTAPCPTCKDFGYVRFVYPSNKPIPCHWFARGAIPCEKCGGDE